MAAATPRRGATSGMKGMAPGTSHDAAAAAARFLVEDDRMEAFKADNALTTGSPGFDDGSEPSCGYASPPAHVTAPLRQELHEFDVRRQNPARTGKIPASVTAVPARGGEPETTLCFCDPDARSGMCFGTLKRGGTRRVCIAVDCPHAHKPSVRRKMEAGYYVRALSGPLDKGPAVHREHFVPTALVDTIPALKGAVAEPMELQMLISLMTAANGGNLEGTTPARLQDFLDKAP